MKVNNFCTQVMPCLSPTSVADTIAFELRPGAEKTEQSMPFGDHNRSLSRRQPRAAQDASFDTVSQACMNVKIKVACTVVHQLTQTQFGLTGQ